MKTVRSRSGLALLLLALGTLLGCAALQGNPAPQSNTRALILSQPTVNLGTVVAGSSRIIWESVYNPTGRRVTVSRVTVTGTGFSLVNTRTPFAISNGGRVWLQVRFAPKAAGTGSGTISLSSNAPDPSTAVSVSAKVVSAGQLAARPSQIAFGNVRVGASSTKAGTLTNTGSTSLTISQVTVNVKDFAITGLSLPVTLAPNQNTHFNVAFAPKSRGGKNANVMLTATVSLVVPGVQSVSGRKAAPRDTTETATLTVPVSGMGTTSGQLNAPASISFGTAQVGSSRSQAITVTNSGTSTVNINNTSVSGNGFTLNGGGMPTSLTAGQSATISCKFSPQSAGAASGTVTISSDATNSSVSVALSGMGSSPSGTLTGGSVSFGTVLVGSSQQRTATITNSGGSAVNISSAQVSGDGFSLSSGSTAITVPAGGSASFGITFAPQAAGNASGGLVITSDASAPSLTVPLSGTAVTAGALAVSPASLSFGSVASGSTQTMRATLSNTGGSTVTVSQASVSASGFSLSGMSLPMTLGAGKSTSFSVVFAPQSVTDSSANLIITSDASNATLTIPLSGSGTAAGSLAVSPASVSFGSVQVGDSNTKQATLTNSGTGSVTISQANVTGDGFKLTGITLPLTLSGGQTFTFNLVFAPQSAGSASGNLSIVSDATGTAPSIALSGTGAAVGQIALSPSTLSFGSVTVGSSKSLTETVSASGGSVTLNSVSASTAEFTFTGLSLPLTLQSGQSKSFTVTFTPASSGSAAASLSFVTADSNPPVTASLTGTAAAAQQHSVALAWNASTSNSVNGYFVYRGGTNGGPYTRLTSSPVGNTSYTDTSVQSGRTYYYVTTAVASDGTESSNSNQVSASIPTP